jgi:heme/copper-type cytochrome/quinol oxidase subunit 1
MLMKLARGDGGGRSASVRCVLLALGGYGFLSMFYLAGVASVPRRYSAYPEELARGAHYAVAAVVFVTVLLAGVVLYLWQTGKRCARAFAS